MKTLCFTLGLLLIIVYCCYDATAQAEMDSKVGFCCFDFSTTKVPQKLVSTIIKTHSKCLNKAFIVETVRGRKICYSQTFQWALDLYNTKTSGQQS